MRFFPKVVRIFFDKGGKFRQYPYDVVITASEKRLLQLPSADICGCCTFSFCKYSLSLCSVKQCAAILNFGVISALLSRVQKWDTAVNLTVKFSVGNCQGWTMGLALSLYHLESEHLLVVL